MLCQNNISSVRIQLYVADLNRVGKLVQLTLGVGQVEPQYSVSWINALFA